MNQIDRFPLWIGHAGDGRDIREIHSHKIRAVVQLAMEEPPIGVTRDMIFLRYPIVDGVGNSPDLLTLAIHSVVALLAKKVPSLVCCAAGMSRSPTIVAAALAVISERDFDETLKSLLEYLPADVSASLLHDVRAAVKQVRRG